MRLFRSISWMLCAVLALAVSRPLEAADYLGPSEVVASPDGAWVYILEADAGRIDVLATAEMKVVRQIAVPEHPNDMTIGPKGQKLYVSAGVSDGVVAEIDAASGKVLRRFSVGHTPSGLVVTPDGGRLFVCNRFD
ncbi:MAG: YncE family protein, partial [Planctomycetota bacterium]